jgi:hypothetical protein
MDSLLISCKWSYIAENWRARARIRGEYIVVKSATAGSDLVITPGTARRRSASACYHAERHESVQSIDECIGM